jgi:hypothetical protein
LDERTDKASFAFTSQIDSDYSFCFTDGIKRGSNFNIQIPKRFISLETSVGDKSKNYEEIAKREKLKPIEVELLKIADQADTLKNEFSYMKVREISHRDTSGTFLPHVSNNRIYQF